MKGKESGVLGGVLGVTSVLIVGVALGIGSYTFAYARGASYLWEDPAVCANCHIMRSHLDAWVKSSHKAVASCNDCHTPHDSLIAKLWVKGRNGFNHSVAFTTGRFPEPLRITEFNRKVTEKACRSCHQGVVDAIELYQAESLSCIRCHGEVGHPR